ncbi:MAG: 1-deoxy-D-xylulose-5-phosphate reductoisomerase [Thermodesulfovibrionales bacterium]
MVKRITILGSTGSVGKNALNIISRHRDRFKVVALTAGKNIALLEKQIMTFSPEVVAVASEKASEELKRRLREKSISVNILSGSEGIAQVAGYENSDFVLSAIVGSAGLIPTISAIHSKKMIGLANKEALVMAGRIVIKEAEKYRVKIIPVDSEHSAIFQCIEGRNKSDIKRIILTASGGPFMGRKIEELKEMKPKDALNHPSWRMGKKISIDSATLMNKGFEMIEAHFLFGLPPERIDILIHPQSIIHSIVEFSDRSCLAQLSVPDMRGPIAYALSYPERLKDVMKSLELFRIEKLVFKRPDCHSFPCLSYAYEAMKIGGTMPSVLNAANEVAVDAFLKGKIRFTEIPQVIKETMKEHKRQPDSDLNAILEADTWAREKAQEVIKEIKR